MCNQAVHIEPLTYVPDRFKTQRGSAQQAMHAVFAPDHFKTMEMCNEIMVDPSSLQFAPDHFKTQEVCNKAVTEDLFSLACVPNWFVTQGHVKLWHDDDDYCNDSEFIKWYEGYQKRKAQKAKIKKELMPVTCHPSR